MPAYTTAGTKALWNSYDMSAKYKDLTWRQTGLTGAIAGMIAFKASGDDYHHAGLVTDAGTVIHASSVYGKTVETPLTAREGWTHLAQHRYIEVASQAKEEPMIAKMMQVSLDNPDSKLNVRNAPGGTVIDKIAHGTRVTVTATSGDWSFVQYTGGSGYVASRYLAEAEELPPESEPENTTTTIMRTDGVRITLDGRWEVVID